jgi:hypothetical protein
VTFAEASARAAASEGRRGRPPPKRNIHGLWNVIGRIFDSYSPVESANRLAAATMQLRRTML